MAMKRIRAKSAMQARKIALRMTPKTFTLTKINWINSAKPVAGLKLYQAIWRKKK